ncbi:hypothetical protein [Streptomyces sp. NPDC087300]|uniref:hypothetical protein n=1 Tax=Streptomyces sp. NPDC087300 TaxID=3365780 RepID=UPI00380FCACD
MDDDHGARLPEPVTEPGPPGPEQAADPRGAVGDEPFARGAAGAAEFPVPELRGTHGEAWHKPGAGGWVAPAPGPEG